MATAAEVAALFTHVMAGLKARGYARSELTDLHVQQMSEHIAFLSVSRVRYKTDGQELERLGETYTFCKTADGWKIVAATMHDPMPSSAWPERPPRRKPRGKSRPAASMGEHTPAWERRRAQETREEQ
jgi:hypothetical protein